VYQIKSNFENSYTEKNKHITLVKRRGLVYLCLVTIGNNEDFIQLAKAIHQNRLEP
jgi:hypothetical protein